ncbi:MAG TPA: hypothetical protein VGM56_21710 [Byssovorax sp.]|jgi:hypothetical protein
MYEPPSPRRALAVGALGLTLLASASAFGQTTGSKSSWDVALDGSVGSTSFSQAGSYLGVSETSTHGQGVLEVTRFVAPVVDDDAPRTLQPFLQRASTVSVSVNAGGFFTRLPGNEGAETDVNVAASAFADVYVTRFLALTAGFSYRYDDVQLPLGDTILVGETHVVSPSAGVGVRIGDARIDLSYAASIFASGGGSGDGDWGTIALGAEVALRRKLYLHAVASAFHAGAGVYAGAEYFLTKDLSGFVDGLGSTGAYTSDLSRLAEYGFDVGVAFWPMPRLRLVAEYALTGNRVQSLIEGGPGSTYPTPPVDGLDNTAFVGALARLP